VGKSTHSIKLLHVIGTFLNGGTERLMLDILSRLDPQTFEVHACAYGAQCLPEVMHRFERAGIKTISFPHDPGSRLLMSLTRHIRRHRFDIVHTHHYLANMYCRPAAALAGAPVIMTYHHNWPGREKGRHRLAFRVLNAWTTANVTVSETIRRYLVNKTGIRPHKVRTIHNGIDTARFRPGSPEDAAAIRMELDIPPRAAVTLAAGRLVEWKRTDLLIRAAPDILKTAPDTFFLIAGDGEMRAPWEQLARALGVSERIRFLGWREHMEKLYRATDLFCVTSDIGVGRASGEGFGLVAVEAMASAVPILAVDHELNREVVTKTCAEFCRPEPDAVASKAVQLLADSRRRAELGRSGRKRALQHFDIKRTVRQLSDLYLQAVSV